MTLLAEPLWLLLARARLGEREVKGPQHNGWIVSLWKKIKRGGIKDDETPWCAAFVGGCLEDAGVTSTRFESAASYLKWGEPQTALKLGAIVVLKRPGGAHVGFCVGHDPDRGTVALLGGNQGDAVSIASFPIDRITGIRWPDSQPLPAGRLPITSAALSRSEA